MKNYFVTLKYVLYGEQMYTVFCEYDAVCGCDLFRLYCEVLFHGKNRLCSPTFLAKRKKKKSEGIKCFDMQRDLGEGDVPPHAASTWPHQER